MYNVGREYRTHHNIAMRLDAVNPESIISQFASSAKQLLELADGKWSDKASNMDHISLGSSRRGR